MKKKILSIFLAVALLLSMGAIASMSVSAALDADGRYVPTDPTTPTFRYYFAMPYDWASTTSDINTAGVYWWNGTDPCGDVAGESGGTLAWPGYKAYRDTSIEGFDNLYYVDCPQDVPTIVWNNYVNGGTDKTLPVYTDAKQAQDCKIEFCAEFDGTIYDDCGLFEWAYDNFDTNPEAFGSFYDNFYIDEEFDAGLVFKYNNMIHVIDPTKTSENFEGKKTYVGEWYFYYGNGEYGNYPTKEAALENADKGGFVDTIVKAPSTPSDPQKPTNPDATQPTTKPGAPSTDPQSSTDPATTDVPASDNTAIQTGEATYAVMLLVLLSAVVVAVVFARKKYE